MAIAENLKHWRQVRGLTQPELAERSEIEQSYLSKLENGRSQASEGVRERLAEALGIDVETLLRDPSRNGHMKRLFLILLFGLALVGAGFAGGYLASGYEVRKVSHDGERLESIWAMAEPHVEIEEIVEVPGGDMRIISGRFDDAEAFRAFTARLIDSGVMGGTLVSLESSERAGHFRMQLKGPRAIPADESR